MNMDIHNKANSVSEAMYTRHSVREYQEKAVNPKILTDLLQAALRTPSWKNSQPWNIHVVQGAAKNELAQKLMKRATEGPPVPEVDWLEKYPADAKKRMFELGMQVYSAAGIDRKDKKARDAFMVRNFEFFKAPVAIFISTSFETNFYIALDIGCLLQSIMLLAREHGLATCPQAALGAFPDVVKPFLKIDSDKKLICGLSLGYAKQNSGLNDFHSPRLSMDQVVTFVE